MLKRYPAISSVLSAMLLIGCAALHKAAPVVEQKETGHKTEDKEEHKAEYEQIVAVRKPVKGVPVTVSYQGGALYRVQVNNNLKTPISLEWDECAYATTAKESVRLIHIQSRNDLPPHPPAQQASSPILPNSQFNADFTGESWLDCVKRNCSPQPVNGIKNARMYLVFNIKGKRVKWQGEVAFVPPKQP